MIPDDDPLATDPFAALRGDLGPTDAQRAHLAERLAASTKVPLGPTGAPTTALGVGKGALVGKWLAVGLAVTVAASVYPRATAPAPRAVPRGLVALPTLPVPPPPPATTALPSAPPAAGTATPRAPATDGAAAADGEEERAIIERARATLRRDPGEALTLLATHGALYPAGAHREEREALAVRALAALGRGAEARARGERFLARWPKSLYGASVAAAAGIEGAP